MMPQGIFPKCKRGVFGLSSWEAQRKPNEPPQEPQKPAQQTEHQSRVETVRSSPKPVPNGIKNDVGPPISKTEKKLRAKYSYKPNPVSPLGKELDMKPGERFTLKSDQNDLWWLVENAEGERGYVPASYMMVDEITGLPWLVNKEEEKVEPVESTFGTGTVKVKPYVSAYNRDQPKEEDPRWRCDVCDKTLNGPKPYSAHMNSKAHKEEVEYARETGRL